MLLRRIELTDVRSYDRASLDLAAGVTLLLGRNAQGKTNLLEAVHRAATGSSHRVAGDAPLVRAGCELGVIRCRLQTDEGRERRIELELATGGRRTRTRVDGQPVRRAADALGVLRVVLFAPEDTAIVRGDPSERRRFLDDLLAQRRPAYAAARADYDRALRQRNQLLRDARAGRQALGSALASGLEVWTEQVVAAGAQLIAARVAAVRTLAAPTDRFYRELADRPEPVGLVYRSTAGEATTTSGTEDARVPDPSAVAEGLRRAFAARAEEERARGLTLVGPHRDELELSIGPLPARGYASHGEVWSLALALKLATDVVLAEVGDRPVVLLDDVFAELDEVRRERLAAACRGFEQVLVTAAVEADVPLPGARVEVALDAGVTRLHPRGPDPTGVEGAA